MLYTIDKEGKTRFHPNIIEFMRNGRNDRLSPMLRGVDVKNVVDHTGSTLLHLSVEYGTRYLSTFFIKVSKIDVNVRNNCGETPLMLATRCMKFEQVRLLLAKGADVRIRSNNGTSALMIVEYCYRDVENLVKLFVEHIRKICDDDYVKIADLLVTAGCQVPYRFEAFRQPEITRVMCERGSLLNARDKMNNGNTPLHTAAENNDAETVEILLQYGADKLAKNRSDVIPFVHVFNREAIDTDILQMLLPDDVDWTIVRRRSEKMRLHPIFISASKNVLELFLRRCRVNFKAKDNHGRTPIHYLVENENDDIWELFENVDFDVDSRDIAGSTALHLAGTLVNPNAVRFLLGRGADANAMNDMLSTPLLNIFVNRGILNYQAAKYHDCIEHLLAYGADVQMIDTNRDSLVSHSMHFREHNLHAPILAHIALLEVSGSSPINHLVKNPIMIDSQLKTFYEACKRDIEAMKLRLVDGSLTYFQLLTDDDDKIASYLNIDDIMCTVLNENAKDSYYVRFLQKRLLKVRTMMIAAGDMSMMDIDRSTMRAGWFDCQNLSLKFTECCTVETMCE